VTVILVRVPIEIVANVLLRKTQKAPATVESGLAFEKVVKGVVEVIL
jgi:hypothetical protein